MSAYILTEDSDYRFPQATALERDGPKVRMLELRVNGQEKIPVAEPVELADNVLVGLGDPPAAAEEVRYSFAGVFLCLHGKIWLFPQARHRTVDGGIVEVFTIDPVRIGTLMDGVVEPFPPELVIAMFKPSAITVWGQGKARRTVGNRPDSVLMTLRKRDG